MEAKETAGLLMTERVARDCSSGLLETTSNRLWRIWSAAKANTHTSCCKKGGGWEERQGEGGRGKWKKEKGLAAKQKCILEDQRDILAQ